MSEKPAPKKEEKKGRSKLVPILVALLVLGGGGGGAYWFFVHKAAAAAAEEDDEETAADGHGSKAREHDDSEKPAGKKRKKTVEAAGLAELEPFVVNLADQDASRFVKAKISLAVDSPEVASHLAGGKERGGAAGSVVLPSRVRAAILELLAAKTAEQITSAEGKTELKGEIRDAVNALLHEGEVVEVLFTDLIVQY